MLYLYMCRDNCDLKVRYDYEDVFDNHFEESWVDSDLGKKILWEIDQCKPVSFRAVDSEIFGMMSPTWISGGTKALLLMLNYGQLMFQSSNLGDNCAPYLEEVSRLVDIHMQYNHPLKFTDTQVAMFPEYGNLKCVGEEEIYNQRRLHYDYEFD